MPPLAGEFEPVRRIVAEMGEVTEGDVYWALPRPGKADAQYIEEAFSRGALGVVVDGRRVEPWAGRFVLEVKDTERNLYDVAAWCRRHYTGMVVAVVQATRQPQMAGWVAAMSHAHDPRTCRLSVTDELSALATSMCNWPATSDFVVVEWDRELDGQLAEVIRLCRPQIGVFAGRLESVKQDVAKWERRREELAAATAAILPKGWLVVDGDDPGWDVIGARRRCRLIRVGCDPSCDVAATQVVPVGPLTAFRVQGDRYTFPGNGPDELKAALAAVAVGQVVGLNRNEIQTGLSRGPADGTTGGVATKAA